MVGTPRYLWAFNGQCCTAPQFSRWEVAFFWEAWVDAEGPLLTTAKNKTLARQKLRRAKLPAVSFDIMSRRIINGLAAAQSFFASVTQTRRRLSVQASRLRISAHSLRSLLFAGETADETARCKSQTPLVHQGRPPMTKLNSSHRLILCVLIPPFSIKRTCPSVRQRANHCHATAP